jgi:hypothetical protein
MEIVHLAIWSRVILEKMLIAQLAIKSSAFHGIKKCSAVFIQKIAPLDVIVSQTNQVHTLTSPTKDTKLCRFS